jgi:hypothetical protein
MVRRDRKKKNHVPPADKKSGALARAPLFVGKSSPRRRFRERACVHNTFFFFLCASRRAEKKKTMAVMVEAEVADFRVPADKWRRPTGGDDLCKLLSLMWDAFRVSEDALHDTFSPYDILARFDERDLEPYAIDPTLMEVFARDIFRPFLRSTQTLSVLAIVTRDMEWIVRREGTNLKIFGTETCGENEDRRNNWRRMVNNVFRVGQRLPAAGGGGAGLPAAAPAAADDPLMIPEVETADDGFLVLRLRGPCVDVVDAYISKLQRIDDLNE